MKATEQADPRPAAGGRLPTPPTALYPCCQEGCREERTWPPDHLSWFDGLPEKRDANGDIEHFAVKAGWYCGECASEIGIEPDGPRLDEVLASNGQTTPKVDGDDRPACADCAFYAANAKASADGQSRELLEQVPHEVADDDCCHPTSLIQQGTGQFHTRSPTTTAATRRRSSSREQGSSTAPRECAAPGAVTAGCCSLRGPNASAGGGCARESSPSTNRATSAPCERCASASNPTGGSKSRPPSARRTAEKLALSTGTICSFTMAHEPDRRPDLDDWQAE